MTAFRTPPQPTPEDQPPPGARCPTLSGRELERLVGVSPERIRTWQRRFGFPEAVDLSSGNRRFYVSDVPRILAASQLIAAGSPVADAIGRILAGELPAPDLDHLAQAFGGLSSPVVAVSGPEPLEILWMNDAARTGAASHGALVVAPDRGTALHRALQHLIASGRQSAIVVEHERWTAPAETARSLAWSIGAPTYTPSIAVMIELPSLEARDAAEHATEAEPEPLPVAPEPADGTTRAWCTAIATARRTLQRETGAAALTGAVSALVDGTDAVDGFVLHEVARGLACGRSAKGRLGPSTTAVLQFQELAGASPDHPRWLTAPASLHFTGRPRMQCLAVPMLSAGRRSGFLVLEFSRQTQLSDDVEQLLLALATTAAVGLARDGALAQRRKAEQAAADTPPGEG